VFEEEGSRSIEEALLSAMNPFELAISQNSRGFTLEGSEEMRDATSRTVAGDTSTSTITGSNEPTPFDASGSNTVFGFGPESMSASNSAGSGSLESSSFDAVTGTPGTSSSVSSQVATGQDHTKMKDERMEEDQAKRVVDEAYAKGEDIVRTIVETVREQRMSLIQTGRQFVFVYSAVLAGILRDLKVEQEGSA